MELEEEIKVLNPPFTSDRLLEIGADYLGTTFIDDVYLRSIYTNEVFRLRTEKNSMFSQPRTYLMHKSKDTAKDNTKRRVESKVLSGTDLLQLRGQLGLEERVRISKRREKFMMNDMIFDFDHTDSLGDIFEIEYKSKDNLAEVMQKLELNDSMLEKRDTYQMLCEKQHGEYSDIERGVAEVARRIDKLSQDSPDRPIIIGVSGASGSGKTHIAEAVARTVNGKVLSLDRYYVENAVEVAADLENNFDHPLLIDFGLMKDNLRKLKNGERTDVPIYSFKTGTREGYETFEPADIIIAEGIFAFYPDIRDSKLYDMTVGVLSDAHLNLLRRLTRDVTRTGLTEGQILNQIATTVFPMYKLHIEPEIMRADVKISNDYNPLGSKKIDYQMKMSVSDFDEAKSRLGEGLAFVRKTKQTDTVFMPEGKDDTNETIKVRFQDNKSYLSFKLETGGGENAKRRANYECTVINNAVNSLISLGYKIVGTIEKEREEYTLGDVKVKFDTVAGLGSFVELEAGNEAALEHVLSTLGVDRCSVTKKSYAEMLYS